MASQNPNTTDPAATLGRAYSSESEEEEIDLVEIFFKLLENAKYIVAVALLGAVLAGLITYFLITPTYTATSKLYVLNSDDSALNLSDLQIGSYLANDYQEVFSNWHVHEMVLQHLGLDYTYTQLSKMVKVSNPKDTRILYIEVSSNDPGEAQAMANEYAKVAQEFIAAKMETKAPTIFEEALLPYKPSSPSLTRNVLIGFVLGVFAVCAVVIIRFLVDDRIHNADEIEKYLGMATLGVMPKQERTVRKRKAAARKPTADAALPDAGGKEEQ